MKDLTFERKYPGMLDRLGKEPDASIAEEYRLTVYTVVAHRKRLGIEVSIDARRAKRVEAMREKYPGMYERLGKEPDKWISDDYGITRAAVHNHRKKLEIESSRGPRKDPVFAMDYRNHAYAWMVSLFEEKAGSEGLPGGMTAVELLAERIDLSTKTIADCCDGRNGRSPTYDALLSLAAELDLQIRLQTNGMLIVSDPCEPGIPENLDGRFFSVDDE